MTIHHASKLSRMLLPAAITLTSIAPLIARSASAAMTIVTPGEQNTDSGEFACHANPCPGGKWLYYPELLQRDLGTGYTVQNNGDGGAVLGCDAATMTVAGGNSFCASGKYTASVATPPDIVIIGPFGEHDQRIVAGANEGTLYMQSVFQAAYDGMIQKYKQHTSKIYLMTPIDLMWNAPNLTTPNGDLVKDIMLPAALAAAQADNVTVIDTYTAMTSTPALVTMYYGSDGQVNEAGQLKMESLILAALNSANGGAGGGGAGGAAGAAGSGAGGAAGGAGGMAGAAGGGGAAQGGASSGGVGGTVAMGGSGGTVVTATGGTVAGGATAQGGSTTAAAGAGGAPGGVATAGSAGTTAATNPEPSTKSGGCALSSGESNGAGGAALLTVALAALSFRRRTRVNRVA
jgi:hypothetical protein